MSKNKKTCILGILMVGVLFFTSCASEVVEEDGIIPESFPATVEETPTILPPNESATADLTYEVETTEVSNIDDIVYLQGEDDVIIPPSVHLRNCSPGLTGEWKYKVYNGSLDPVIYTTAFRYPDLNHLNASAPPNDIGDWITIENPMVNMEGQSEGIFNYSIDIPEEAELPEISEFWVVIKKADQTSFVQWEVILRCYLYRRI